MDTNILVVEDDQEIAFIIRDHLQTKGFHVTLASTGKEGWQDFEQGTFDLAIIDIMLPELNGFDLCERIRMKSDIPLLILSAKTEDEDKVRGLGLGANDYMIKPFSLHELSARVNAQIRRHTKWRKHKAPTHISLGRNYVIHPERSIVTHDGEVLPLTPKEFEILLLFVQNPNKMFTKKEIYKLVWHEDCEGEQTVTVHMKGLRDKLQEDKKSPNYIETVWGSGYRFIGDVQYEN